MEQKEIYHILSNTHWDREWYQSHEKYLVRLVTLFDRLLAVMEKEPRYRFITDGQVALVSDYLAMRPEKRELVQKLTGEGRLLIGPWYTQPLENIVGGEALVRNLQYGIDEAEKLGGAMRFSYEIDEFGHASQIPQILSGFGIPSAMAWRGIPKNTKSVFEWIAPDGSSVNMFYSRNGYGFATALPSQKEDYDETIDGTVLRRPGLISRVEELREYALYYSVTDHMFWLNGIDHSWAQEDLFAVIDEIRELFPDITVKQSTPAEFADAVMNDYRQKGLRREQVCGELLYTREDILESTNALHPRQKMKHALSEFHLVRRLEPLTAAASLLGREYPRWAVDRAWKYVLENHAHDSLGCCSVDEVYEQVMARYGAAISLSEQLEEDSLRYIMSCSADEPSVFIFNLSSYPVQGVNRVTLHIPDGYGSGDFELLTSDGQPIGLCVTDRVFCGDVRYNPEQGHPTWGRKCTADVLIDLPPIPAFGYLRLKYVNTDKDAGRVDNRRYTYMAKQPGVMENEKLRVVIRPDGTFDLTDKNSGRTYTRQMLFEDTGEAGDVYIHIEPSNDRRRIFSCAPVSVTELFDTPLGTSYEIRTQLSIPDGISPDRTRRSDLCKPLFITAVLTLLKDSDRVDVRLHCENNSRYHRLRVLFPSYLEKAENSAGAQAFDWPERPIREEFDPELPREQQYPTHPMLGCCAVSDGKSGLAVAARGLFEYECTDDEARALAVTLIRSNEVIDTKTFAETPEYICHEAQNLTAMDFELSLIPFAGTKENVFGPAEAFLDPVIALTNRQTEDSVMPGYVRPADRLGNSGTILTVQGSGVVVTTFKRAMHSGGYIVRLLNTSSEERNASVVLSLPGVKVSAVYETDLEEKRIRPLKEAACVLPGHKLVTFEFTAE